jgi:AraC family transcriptional regulator, transcriptional activator of pobA
MHHFRSLFIDRVNVRIPGLQIFKFALHRHLSNDSLIELHRHKWSQVILYLHGQGQHLSKEGTARVEPGTLVVLPPAVWHGFQRTAASAPLCLMINFRLRRAQLHGAVVCSVHHADLTQIRQHLGYLLKLQARDKGVLHWESAMVILQLLISMLRVAGWLERVRPPSAGETGAAIRRLLSRMDPTASSLNVVKQSGYHRDHLNRLVKKETGLTLGQFRMQLRLEKAKDLLSSGVQVGNVATMVGFLDQSYFARWFRRQTGQPPSRWSRRGLGLTAEGQTSALVLHDRGE